VGNDVVVCKQLVRKRERWNQILFSDLKHAIEIVRSHVKWFGSLHVKLVVVGKWVVVLCWMLFT
jgi:hypothetical protein